MKPTVLLVEDNAATRFGFVRYFSKEGYHVVEAADLAEAGKACESRQFDAMILDINLPDGNGIDFIDAVRAANATVPIIAITGSGDIPLAVEAMQRGADNFLTKPVNNATLSAFLRKTLEIGQMKRRLSAQKRLTKQEDIFFGTVPSMCQVKLLAQAAAAGDSPVMILGETGTGKGMLASWIHRNSRREPQEFVEVNCSGLRGDMLSREIFGHVRGAFTSADQDRKGLLDIADRGTLFLDEIGDMGLEIQAQFLKVLEEKTYRRLGDVKTLSSDFRLICATHRNIAALVEAGTFRQDLMYRINLMAIEIPPLRERCADLPEIVAHLLRSLGAPGRQVSEEVMGLFRNYPWPGNLRELRNVLERALLLTPRGMPLSEEHFSVLKGHRPPAAPLPAQGRPHTVQEVEAAHIRTVLAEMNGDMNRAARTLNISRATLYRRLKQLREQ